ncbi:MAG: COX15/CtaA family protein, partial [Chloroflexota bacterium]
APKKVYLWNGAWNGFILIGLMGMLVLGASGAVTALGDTLYPSTSLLEGFRQDFDPTAHFLIRLRVFHPAIAILVGVYTLLVTTMIKNRFNNQQVHRAATWLARFYVLQLGLGVINVLLLAPVWMQITHLLVTNVIWICWMWVAESFFGGRVMFEGIRDDTIHKQIGKALSQ